MSQADLNVANQSGAAFRADLNTQLLALGTLQSGASEPGTTYAYMLWADSANGLLKQRNAANNGWVSLGSLVTTNLGMLPIAGGTMTGALGVTAGTVSAPGVFFSGDTNTGLYSPSADTLALATAGTNRLHITSAGLVGIGTTAPTGTLEVGAVTGAVTAGDLLVTTGSTTATVQVGRLSSTSSDNTYFNVRNRVGTSVFYVDTGNQRVGVGASTLTTSFTVAAGGVGLELDTSLGFSNRSNTGTLRAYDRGTAAYKDLGITGENILFGIQDTEKARIDSSGRLLVGIIASPAYQLQVSTDSAGKPSSALWTIVSDERIKEDIELADLDLCYEAIKAIPLKRYKWRDDIYTAEQVTDRRKLGWIAQDVEAIFPKAVGTHEFKYNQVFEETIIPAVEEELDADGNVITPAQPERIEQGDLISEDVIEDCRDLNSDQLYAAMYGAIQKLMAKVEALEIEVASLKAS